MDVASLASSILTAQAGGLQTQIADTILKQSADAEKSAVQTLMGTPSTANLGAGIGGNLNITA